MNLIIEKFANAIKEAELAAITADQDHDDGGTCNLDTPMIDFSGWSTDNIKKVAEASGISIGDKHNSGHFKGCCFVRTTVHGQAQRRTRMAEAAYKSLLNNGIPAVMWYQAD